MNTAINLTKPSINLKAKRPDFAIAGHIGSLIAALIAFLLSLSIIFNGRVTAGIFGILVGIFVIVIEIDAYIIPDLKEALTRGIVWIILGILIIYSGVIATLALIASGACYVYYHYE